jgi:hypothetical protein
MISKDELRRKIDEFASEIGGSHLGLAIHEPAEGAIWRNCIGNAGTVRSKRGGGVCYGWTFQHKISAGNGEYLVATHHAVWHRQDGKLVDVTPFPDDPQQHPISPAGSVLFLVDANARPKRIGKALVPLALQFFPVSGFPKIESYVRSLQASEAQEYEKMCNSLRS